MSPTSAEAERIAAKHLAGASPERRVALAQDIVEAIGKHAERVAHEAIKSAMAHRVTSGRA